MSADSYTKVTTDINHKICGDGKSGCRIANRPTWVQKNADKFRRVRKSKGGRMLAIFAGSPLPPGLRTYN